MFIENFPENGWVNLSAKNIALALVTEEQYFANKKATVTLSSLLVTLASVFKEDAGNIAIILARPNTVINIQPVQEVDPNPGINSASAGCDTCPGGKIPIEVYQVPQNLVTSKNVEAPIKIQTTSNEEKAVKKNLVLEEKLIVSKEHTTGEWKNPAAVWKHFSGDVDKLREAAKVLGLNNIELDDAKTLAQKIYNKSKQK